LMQNLDSTPRVLERLHAQGVLLALDDFGTGYSSLCCLGRYPLDRLKIDRSFLVGLGRDERDTSVVRAILALGHSLGKQVVAEGVERSEQVQLLQEGGCEEAQGFLYSPPLSAADLESWLNPSAPPPLAAVAE
jgi:EAL domain-containing protein (putative c-di-GMP-specific phosphodiesterase class I)